MSLQLPDVPDIAIDELYHQKVKILPEEETTEEEEQNA